MFCALIGWKVAGWVGAVTATVALYLPSSLVAYGATQLWGRWRGSAWHTAVERGLAPIAAGLLLSGGLAVLRVSPGGAAVWVAAVAATAVLLRRPSVDPLVLLLAGGALFGLAGAAGLR